MFSSLFKRAEASMDSAIGDLGNRVVITIPFLIALGFGAASLAAFLNRLYGPELGNLLVAVAFCLLGGIVALVVRIRRRVSAASSATAERLAEEQPAAETGETTSIFDDDALMAVLSAAAPIIVPAALRTGLKNWPVLLLLAATIYLFSRSNQPVETTVPAAS